MEKRERLVAVVGATASGKSDLGVALALRFGGEVVSADSRQVYRGLDVGSGKITPEETRGVPHHLLDILDPGAFFSMADYQRAAYAAIDGICARGRLPFLVGGTGLYAEAVLDGYELSDIKPDLAYRERLETLTTPALYERLTELVPDVRVDANNRNRVMRMLEKLHDGDTITPAKRPRYETLRLGVTWERETLCRRIDERLLRRAKNGLIEEVRGLLDAGVSADFLLGLGLEYRSVTRYLLGEVESEDAMLEELSRAIKRFAKRQMTWFRRDSSIRWLDMEGDPLSQAAEAISAFLN